MCFKVMSAAVFFLSLIQVSFSQEYFSVRAKLMYNRYDFSDFKEMQQREVSSIRKYGIQASAVESFPAYQGVQLQVLVPVIKNENGILEAGIFYDYSSSGARTHYSDYSGELKTDYLFKANTVGLALGVRIDISEHFILNPSFGFPLTYSSFGITSYERVWDYGEKEQLDFSNHSYGVMPGVSLSYVLKGFLIGISLDYQAVFSQSEFTMEGINGQVLYKDSNKTPVENGMNGLKAGIMIGYSY